MSFNEIWRALVDGLTYDLFKLAIGSLIVTAVVASIAKILKKLENVSEIIKFSAACFVGVFVLLFLISPKTQSPQLAGSIQTAVAGGFNDNHDTVAVFTVTVLNSGSMQSIVKNWNVTVTINSRIYQGAFIIPPPKDFTFTSAGSTSNAPTGITYHADDNIMDKAIIPIPPGGLTTGVLFVLFHGIEPNIFKTGADYTLSYEDALSKKYTILLTSTAQSGPIAAVSGIHADLICPKPKL